MAELVWSFAVQEVLKKIVKLAAEQMSLAWGFKKELAKLKDSLLMMETILHDLDRIKAEHKAVKLWVEKLEDVVFEADVLLDKIAFEDLRRKVETGKEVMVSYFVSSSKNPLVFRLKMASKIKGIAKALHEHYRAASAVGLVAITSKETESDDDITQILETDSFLDEIGVIGREIEVCEIVNKLIDPSHHEALFVLPIVGLGGLGKTAVAKVIFNHEVIRENFDTTLWVYVSKSFVIKKILRAILETLNANSCGFDSKEALLQELKKWLNDKRYFLVLDDVWNENLNLWNELKACLLKITKKSGCVVVVTTRSDEVAEITETQYYSRHYLRRLSDDHCWSLFEKCAFINEWPTTLKLDEVREELVEKFSGIPLVVKALGGMVKIDKNRDGLQCTLENLIRILLQDENYISTIKLGVDRLPLSFSLKQYNSSKFSQDFKFKRE
ncbi:putative disease resistance protein RGA3 [Momordica charantia]|uniref:Disease resistance protein RGA3 n=1 Tax=Momordica charantia TaxID=3673 RepID=A0A6J1CVQ5_MOMCH|nr:putative disease resistance protein RGA3 [Momordica charantia]